MSDTPEAKAAEDDAKATVASISIVASNTAVAIAHDAERDTRSYFKRFLTWLKSKF